MAINKSVKKPTNEDAMQKALNRLDGGTIKDVHVVLMSGNIDSLRFTMADGADVTLQAVMDVRNDVHIKLVSTL